MNIHLGVNRGVGLPPATPPPQGEVIIFVKLINHLFDFDLTFANRFFGVRRHEFLHRHFVASWRFSSYPKLQMRHLSPRLALA